MSADLHEVDAERRASVAMDVIHAGRSQHARQHRRPPALTAREALAALSFEALVVWTAIANLRGGIELSAEDFDRLTLAARRIQLIAEEVTG